MKIFLSISIILLLAYSQYGYYIVLHHLQSAEKETIKQKIFAQVSEKELQVVSLTDNKHEIFWEEEGKEFLFRGDWYDVVKTKCIDGKIILYCINDKKEAQLVAKYNSITKHNTASDKNVKHSIDPILLFTYCDEHLSVNSSYNSKLFHLFVTSFTNGLHASPYRPPINC